MSYYMFLCSGKGGDVLCANRIGKKEGNCSENGTTYVEAILKNR